ncbi:MAG: hypothetical protein ACJ72N_07530 [Labedaea sp.]|jgi:hypothetical protein
MSIATMILGESGTGKTTSLRNVDPASALLIQAVNKPLPFRNSEWKPATQANPSGSIYVTDDSRKICTAMQRTKRQIVILDDFQYVLANEFMRRNQEKGYDKFNDIGRNAWDILTTANSLPPDTRVYILAHTHSDESGKVRAKTIGRMLDDKITVEGLFTIVLRTAVINGQYLFSTQNSGHDTVKSPLGLFGADHIDNDLQAVDSEICQYFNINQA